MKRKSLFSKLIDYNNELEKVLEKKNFSYDVRNLLLSTLYKIETSYSDYTKTKVNVVSKEIYISEIINYIYFFCKKIEIMVPKTQDEININPPIVDKRNKSIKVFPNEKKALEAIIDLSKPKVFIDEKYGISQKPLEDFFDKTYIINELEVIRDFDGWTWQRNQNEIGDLYYNLLYQNLIMLIGINNTREAARNDIEKKDYVEIIKKILVNSYGKEIGEKVYYYFLLIITQIYSKKNNINYVDYYEKLLTEKEKTVDKEKYFKLLSTKKKQKILKIKKITEILENKFLLQQEYLKESHKNTQIFSIKNFKDKLEKNKEKYIEEVNKIDKLLDSKVYEDKQKKLDLEIKFLLDINNTKIEKNILILQKCFIDCLGKKLEIASTKKDIINLFGETRYYSYLEVSKKIKIKDIKALNIPLENYINKLIIKALELKAINNLTVNINFNIDVFKKIIKSKIIDFENIDFMICNDFDGYVLRILDDESIEYERKIDISEFEGIKINKRIKLFN